MEIRCVFSTQTRTSTFKRSDAEIQFIAVTVAVTIFREFPWVFSFLGKKVSSCAWRYHRVPGRFEASSGGFKFEAGCSPSVISTRHSEMTWLYRRWTSLVWADQAPHEWEHCGTGNTTNQAAKAKRTTNRRREPVKTDNIFFLMG